MVTKFLSAPWAALRRKARRLSSDRRGAIAPAGALLMIPLTLLAFGAVEFHRYTAVRSNLQDALDAAALAVARSTSKDPAVLQQIGDAVLRAQVPFDANLRLSSFTVTLVNGVIVTDARVSVTPIIANLVMTGDLQVTGRSEVLREVRGLEVALVLDTTGSMATNSRITIAKAAAKGFVDQMKAAAAGTTTPDAVRIALVPFANTVNVGPNSQVPAATWLDQNALSPVHAQVFHRGETGPGPLFQPQEVWNGNPNRFTMLANLGAPWAGCVESRPFPHDTQDTAPGIAQPETLIVPYFAPDEPDQINNARDYNPNLPNTAVIQGYRYSNSYVEDFGRALRGFNQNPATWGWRFGDPWPGYNLQSADPVQVVAAFYRYAAGNNLVEDGWKGVQGRVAKYSGGPLATRLDLTGGKGPNRGCAVQPLTRLSTNYDALKTDIDNMTIGGNTNIPMGLVWGWHMVSPNMPFGASPASTRGVKRVVVLMTDGDNWLGSDVDDDLGNMNGSEYSGTGYAWQNRLGTTSRDPLVRQAALNGRLTTLCNNMRGTDAQNPNVIVYTIRVEVTGGDPNLLRNCATQPDMFYDVRDAAALTDVFIKIARSIQNLRIAK